MKTYTLKCLIVSQSDITDKRKADIETARFAMEKYSGVPLEVIFEYRTIRGFLEGVKLEHDNTDLDEDWIQQRLDDLRYHIVHIDMTVKEWEDLGLKKNLYGQSQAVKTKNGLQGITYGRWTDSVGQLAYKKLPTRLRKELSPVGVGVWHEIDHTIRNFFDIDSAWTHYYFYGYDRFYSYDDSVKPKRYVRTPDPDKGWRNLPLDQLDSITVLYKREEINLLEKVVAIYHRIINQRNRLHKRLPDPYNEMISQDYGVKNARYPKTGRHIGIDYACPVGTPIYAPWDGEVVVIGNDKILGNYCFFKYEWEGKIRVERNLHMKYMPVVGKYKRGWMLGRSGDTGDVTGPHYHVDGWHDEIKIGSINSKNWDKLTYNPHI